MDGKPEFTVVNEDFPYERNAEFTLLAIFLFHCLNSLIEDSKSCIS